MFHKNDLFLVLRRMRKPLFTALILTVILNCVLVAQNVVEWINIFNSPITALGDSNSTTFTISEQPSFTLINMKIRISVALLITAFTFYFSRVKALLISFLPLSWIAAEYLLWWLRAYNLSVNAAALDFSIIPHTFYLISGTWWDIWILALVLIIIAFNLTTLNLSKENPI